MGVPFRMLGVAAAAVVLGGASPVSAAPRAAEQNARPKLTIVSVRMVGSRVYARVRICDDSRRKVAFLARDTRRGVASYTRTFTTRTPPRPCAAYSWSWRPAARFLTRGSYAVVMWVRDAAGLTSPRTQMSFLRS